MKRIFNSHIIVFISICSLLPVYSSCEENDTQYPEGEDTIMITDKIFVDNGVKVTDPVFNYNYYDEFLKHISSSDNFIIVPLKDFKNTNAADKVVISMRYDLDFNIDAAIRFAYREHKYGIKSTYFVLHTATYYGKKVGKEFVRNDDIIFYLKKIQDDFGHEIGFHNDLVTLQLMYEIPSVKYLRNELNYLRGNGIEIKGTTYHGSQYCTIYEYSNAYFWKEYPNSGWNYEYIKKGFKTIKIEKDSMKNYNLEYEGNLLNPDYFFADAFYVDGKRWNMSMINIDTIKPGKKVIILLHPGNWN